MDGPAEKLSTVFQQIIAKSVSVQAKQCLVCLRSIVLALRVAREGVCVRACVRAGILNTWIGNEGDIRLNCGIPNFHP